MAKNEVANVSRYYVPNLGTGHYLWGGGGGKSLGGSGLFYFREKGLAKQIFTMVGGGSSLRCFVKNHTHYNSCGRSKQILMQC